MSLPSAHLDVETRSTCELKSAGLYRYFEDPTTECIVVRFRIGNGPILGEADLDELKAHIAAGGLVVGHNIAFDRTCWNTLLAPDCPLPVEQADCTMARAAALALPQSLDMTSKALGLKSQKDAEGHRLMLRMCKPRKIHEDGRIDWWESPEQMQRLGDYCDGDVYAESEADRVLLNLSKHERKVWMLDQKINERGVQVDIGMVLRAKAVAEVAVKAANARMAVLTDGAVKKSTEVAKIVSWLGDRGVVTASLAKGHIEDVLVCADMFDDAAAREVVELRRASAKSSVAKYKAMENSVCADGRVRGTLNYHGAATGRWAGRLIQPQNLPRILDAAADVLELHEILKSTDDPKVAHDHAALHWSNPLEILSRALRSMIISAPGHRLLGADYANIEGRVNAWLSGEKWKTQAFFDYDNGVGADLYKLAYAKAFRIDLEDVTYDHRQIGKVMELSMGYQGGVRAFQKMGANYGVVVSDDRAEELKSAWREAHPSVVSGWWELQGAAIQAVRSPGMKVPVYGGRVSYLCQHGFLWCRLPSMRVLAYASPSIIWTEPTAERKSRPQVQFYGVDSMTKKWGPNRLYGGLQCENIVQAVARDVLVESMFRLEAAGYPLVLTVHDENICEMPNGQGSVEELSEIMSIVPDWADGLPVAVSAWEDFRYVK